MHEYVHICTSRPTFELSLLTAPRPDLCTRSRTRTRTTMHKQKFADARVHAHNQVQAQIRSVPGEQGPEIGHVPFQVRALPFSLPTSLLTTALALTYGNTLTHSSSSLTRICLHARGSVNHMYAYVHLSGQTCAFLDTSSVQATRA
jgi:hypothetical protein